MMDLIHFLFDTSKWPPRWYCGQWSEALGWTHIISDLAIAGAYLAIPLILAYFCYNRRDLPFYKIFILFGLFIVFCGSTHLLSATIFWYPIYRFDGLVKVLTAIVSWAAVLALIPAIPTILRLPKLEEINELLESHLRESRERLELAFEGTGSGLWDVNLLTNEMKISNRFAEFLGYQKEELTSSFDDYLSRLHPEEKEQILKALDAHFKQRIPFNLEHRMLTKSGEYRWFHSVGQAKWNNGTPIRMAGSISDIHQQKEDQQNLIKLNAHLLEEIEHRKQVEKQLEETVEELKLANKEMEAFAYITSHDLRAPLISLKGFSEELKRSLLIIKPAIEKGLPQLSEEQQAIVKESLEEDIPKAIKFISSSVDKMDYLTTSLLKVSRLGMGKLNFTWINTNELVKNTINALQHQIKETNTTIEVGNLPNVTADDASMQQIFGNLLDNAIKYLDPKRPGKIEISGQQDAHETIFIIKDNGRGIAEENKDKIFTMFRRLNPEIPGEGLGLAFIKTLIHKHKGKITFHSTFGQGTEFIFTISNHLKNES
jgi:PAS domain S-box-containing protein